MLRCRPTTAAFTGTVLALGASRRPGVRGGHMDTVYFDANLSDDERRRRLYDGKLFVYSAKPAALALCRFAQELLEEGFPGLDPRKAQHALGKEEYAAILGRLKPHFINHPRSKQLLQQLL